MTLPSFNAEQSLYRSSRHYRASALASAVGRIRPSNAPVPPPGSYQRTCFDISYEPDGTTLCAICCDEHGFISGSCLDGAFWCHDDGYDIVNCDGTLECAFCSYCDRTVSNCP